MNNVSNTSRFDYNIIPKKYLEDLQYIYLKSNGSITNKSIKDYVLKSNVLSEIIKITSNQDSIYERYWRSQKRMVTSAANEMKIKQPTIDEMMTLLNGTFLGITLLDSITKKGEYATAYANFIWARLDLSKVKNGTRIQIYQHWMKSM